jgi:hypothetical protein
VVLADHDSHGDEGCYEKADPNLLSAERRDIAWGRSKERQRRQPWRQKDQTAPRKKADKIWRLET